MADNLQNREIFRKAMSEYDPDWGYYNQPALAGLLDCSKSHIANLLSGAKPLSGRTKDKLDALIAAKGDGAEPDPWPAERDALQAAADAKGPETVEQAEVDLQAQDIIDQADDAVEPAGSYLNRLVIGTGYRVEGVPGGGYRITQTVAECVDQSFARAICDLLNKDGG